MIAEGNLETCPELCMHVCHAHIKPTTRMNSSCAVRSSDFHEFLPALVIVIQLQSGSLSYLGVHELKTSVVSVYGSVCTMYICVSRFSKIAETK